MQTNERSRESGFSLIELTVALTITLVISAAIYGLLAKGGSGFRREPELTDRQQNIRVAMDLIMRDISQAGQKMGAWFQVFTNNPNLNGAGPLGSSGQNSDFLEIWLNDGSCPDAPADPKDPTDGANLNTAEAIPRCYSDNSFVLVVYGSGNAKWGLGWNIHAQDGKFNFPPGKQPPGSQINGPGDLANYSGWDTSKPERISSISIVRYEIATEPGGDGSPNLYRSATGGKNPDDANSATYVPAPSANGGWQLVARGIEDMQVQYKNGSGAWADRPGDVSCINCATPTVADYNTLVREVRVTLSARSTARNLEGQTTNASVGNAVRGSLTGTFSPRAALNWLTQARTTITPTPSPLWN